MTDLKQPPAEHTSPIDLVKKPTTVRAIRWTGDNQDAVRDFAGSNTRQQVRMGWLYNNLETDRTDWDLELLAGVHGAQGWVPVPIGHWIFGAPGDFWPVAHDYVVEHYEIATVVES